MVACFATHAPSVVTCGSAALHNEIGRTIVTCHCTGSTDGNSGEQGTTAINGWPSTSPTPQPQVLDSQ